MLGYIILFVLFALITSLFKKKPNRQLFWLMTLLTVFSGIRYGIGYDYFAYYYAVLDTTLFVRFEPIPRYLINYCSNYGPWLFFVLSSAFISFFIGWGIKCENKRYYWMSVLIFLCFPFFFIYGLGVVRQAMAFSIVFFAAMRFRGKPIIQILLCALAFFCHYSSVISLFILLPWHKIKTKYLWIGFISCFFIGDVVFGNLLGLSSSIVFVNNFISYVFKEDVVQDASKIRYVLYIIAIFCIAFRDLPKLPPEEQEEHNYQVGLVALGASLFALFYGLDGALCKRLSSFFFMMSIVAVPRIVYSKEIKKEFVVAAFVMLFAVFIYVGSDAHERLEDTNETSYTYPYRTIIPFIK